MIEEAVAFLFTLNLSGAVVALRACIDASTRDNGTFAVAGVAFGYDRARKANREWERLLDGHTFHMTDLNARANDFSGISDEDVNKIMRGIVSIIKRNASYITAVSCDENLVDTPFKSGVMLSQKQLLSAFRSTYGFMCHLGMASLGEKANDGNVLGGHVSYVFESGDTGQPGLIKFLDYLESRPAEHLFLDMYSLSGKMVMPKSSIEGIFHSADFVAWEWAKHSERHSQGKPMRRSLSVLFDGSGVVQDKYGITLSNGTGFFARYFLPERLERSLAYFRAVIEANSEKEVIAAFNRWKRSS